MADARATLKSLLLSLNLCDENTANTYINSIEIKEASKLIDVISQQSIGKTGNLDLGTGGGLTALKRFLNSMSLDKAELPKAPKSLEPEEKKQAIKELNSEFTKSDKDFIEALRITLAHKRTARISSLKAWAVELSDEDFPVALERLNTEMKKEHEKLSEQVRKKMKKNRKQVNSLAKSHKTLD